MNVIFVGFVPITQLLLALLHHVRMFAVQNFWYNLKVTLLHEEYFYNWHCLLKWRLETYKMRKKRRVCKFHHDPDLLTFFSLLLLIEETYHWVHYFFSRISLKPRSTFSRDKHIRITYILFIYLLLLAFVIDLARKS